MKRSAAAPRLGYPVVVEAGALSRLGGLLADHVHAHRFAIITDDQVGPLYATRVAASLGTTRVSQYVIPAGEAHKTRETWASITDRMVADGHGRDSAIIALGGGVVGDLAGFVAATFMRGIALVQVPTSLLAMVDASIGGKTGVDTAAGKNLVGAFHDPACVVGDTEVLVTLPSPHRRAGLAEALKHGVIADATYFNDVAARGPRVIDGSLPAADAARLVRTSVDIKSSIVARDRREAGLRKLLNFGHTVGHAIEAASGYAMLHGEAVAIGMVIEARIAERLDIAERATAMRIWEAVLSLGLPIELPFGLSPTTILDATRTDKKARRGAVEYALPSRIGTMAGANNGWSIQVADSDVLAVLSTHPTASR